MRDDFTQPTIEIIARRAGYRCSNPNCGRQTFGPSSQPAETVNIGVAAHITAASERGPRRDPTLTPEQRRHPDNGLWLCQVCAKLIDSDASYYTIALLHRWKDQAEQAARRDQQQRVPSTSTPAPYMPPRPLPDFVGRDAECQTLDAALTPGTRTAITGVVGMGGIGKTELAKLAASRVAARFPDGVLWADCGTQEPTAIADQWAAQYGVQLAGDDPAAKAASWRSLVAAREALLIFDNVQPGQDIHFLLNPQSRSAVLLTTRDAGHLALEGAHPIPLDHFTEDEATALVDKIRGPEAACQAADARQLFELVGYLPLAKPCLGAPASDRPRLVRLRAPGDDTTCP